MKKKFLALLTAGILACGLCTSAFAEVDPSKMEEVAYDESAFDGEWASFEGGFDLYLPTDWVDVTDDIEEENVTFAMQSEDGAAAVVVGAVDTGLGEDATIDEVAASLSTLETYTVSDTYYNVNEIYCVGVTNEEGYAGYAFLGTDGYCYMVFAGPVTDDNLTIISGILNSISASEAE